MEVQKPTERQVQIVEMLARGLRQTDIGSNLRISARTVENELKEIRQIWALESLPAITHYFTKNGWIK